METTVTVHQIVVNLVVRELEVIAAALFCATETDGMGVLVVRFCH